MSKLEKLIQKLQSNPKDLKWAELEKVLSNFGFNKLEGSGSRVKFFNESLNLLISLHKPHPKPTLKSYQIKQIIEVLNEGGLL